MSRITWVLPPMGLSGGVRVASVYAQKLRERGHTLQVVAPPHKQPTLKRRVGSVLKGQGKVKSQRNRPHHFQALDLPVKVLETYRPVEASDVPDADVIIATWWQTAQWVSAMPASKGAKVYFIQHDESHLTNQPADQVRATWALPMRKVCVAQWLTDRVGEAAGGYPVTTVPNSVDGELFFSEPRERSQTPVVGTMLSKEPWKGSDICFEAVRLAAKDVPGLTLSAFGELDPVGPWAMDPGWQYEHRPSPKRLREIYAGCDAWLFGSRFEGFGLPILEAMACRTPVIGTPAGAAPELIAKGGGTLLDSQDPAAMARAIVDLVNAPADDWRAMSDAAHRTAAQYTWDDAADRFAAELRAAIDADTAQPRTHAAPGATGGGA